MSNIKDNIQERLKHAIERCENYLKDYNNIKIKIDELTFKEGDVVKHPVYGNCIVCSILAPVLDRHSFSVEKGLEDEEIIVTVSHKNGVDQVSSTEIIPYNDMSKVLYDED